MPGTRRQAQPPVQLRLLIACPASLATRQTILSVVHSRQTGATAMPTCCPTDWESSTPAVRTKRLAAGKQAASPYRILKLLAKTCCVASGEGDTQQKAEEIVQEFQSASTEPRRGLRHTGFDPAAQAQRRPETAGHFEPGCLGKHGSTRETQSDRQFPRRKESGCFPTQRRRTHDMFLRCQRSGSAQSTAPICLYCQRAAMPMQC